MKKKLLITLSVMIMTVALALTCFGGCATQDPPVTGEYSVTLSDPTLQLDVLDRTDISATVKNSEGKAVESEVKWTSSDSSVVTVSNGTVDALKAGTATITAEAEGKNAVCEVTVSAIVRPQLIVAQTEITLKEGKSAQIAPAVKFKSRTLDNSEYNITYKCEAKDGDVVSVTDAGIVKAKKAGETEITVKANLPLATSAGLDGNLTQTVKVTVVPDYEFEIAVKDTFDTNIYLAEASDGENAYRSTSEVTVKQASVGGTAIESGWVFKSSDATVATVSAQGVITLTPNATENDKVKIYAEYDNGGVLIKSNEIEFTVLKATLDKALSDELTIDLSVENPTIEASLFGEGFVITDVKDSEKPSASIWNNGVFNKEAVTGFGERKLIIESEKINYRVDAWMVSKVITTATEITSLFNPQSGNGIPVVDGYYVLGQDIEAGNATFAYKGWSSADGVGLVGTFDGRGHTVNGFKINTAGGIFGVISKSGTVRNVAFTNVEVNSTGQALILAYFVHGTVENVFVSVNKLASTSGESNSTAGLVSQTAGDATLKNLVLIYNSDISVKAGNYGALEANSNVGAWENVFVVSGDKLFGGAGTSGDGMSKYGKSAQKFATMPELFASDYYNDKKAEYPDGIWDIANMTFKSSADYIKAELDTLGAPLELTVGEATTVATNSRIYALSTASNKLKIENGTVTALQTITTADNVTLTVSWGGTEKTITVTASPANVKVEHGYYSFNAEDLSVSSEAFADMGDIVSVKLGSADLTSQASVLQNTLTVAKGAIDKTMYGPQELVVSATNKNITVKLTVAYKLTTKTDVLSLYDYLVSVDNIKYDGYLILGNDIDLEGVTISGATEGGIAKNGNLIFAGVFDGCNHKISNYKITGATSAGLSIFSKVTGTIKNLRIEDVTVSGKSGALVGNELREGGQLENIYVSGVITGDGIANGNALQNFGSSLLVGRISTNNNKITNVVIEAKFSDPEPTLYLGSAFGVINTGYENATFENCFVICENDTFAFRKKGANCTLDTANPPADWTLQAFNTANKKGNGNFNTMAEALANSTVAGILEGLGVGNSAN